MEEVSGIETERTSVNNIVSYQRGDETIIIDPGIMSSKLILSHSHNWVQELSNKPELRVLIMVTHGHWDHWNQTPELMHIPNLDTIHCSNLTYRFMFRYGVIQQDPFFIEMLKKKRQPLSTALSENIKVITVPHSIPDTTAITLSGKETRALYLGDFKLTGFPLASRTTTIAELEKIAPVDSLALNVINAHLPGFTLEEARSVQKIEKIIKDAPGRVIVAIISTNLERIEGIIRVAKRMGRPVAFIGESMQHTANVLAAERGVYTTRQDDISDKDAVLFVTGCRGEENSVLDEALNGFSPLKLDSSDTVIFSSRSIPGNEKRFTGFIFNLLKGGSKVVVNDGEIRRLGLPHSNRLREARVHVSGHGNREDIKTVLEILRPKKVLPQPVTPPQRDAFRKIVKDSQIKTEIQTDPHVFIL